MKSLDEFYNNVDDLVYSVLVFLITVYFCNFLRNVLIREEILGKVGLGGHDFRMTAAEMIGTMESAVICYELNFIIYELFGVPIYTLMLFLSLMWQTKRSSEFAYIANPSYLVVNHIKAVRGTVQEPHFANYLFLLFMLLGEFAGVALAYYWVTNVVWKCANFWTFWRVSNHHMARVSPKSWHSQLRTTPMYGMAFEGGFTILTYILPKLIKHKTDFTDDTALILINAGRAIFSGIAQPYTGGFYNPILATAVEYTVGGHTLATKFQVYWITPIAATVLAMFLTN